MQSLFIALIGAVIVISGVWNGVPRYWRLFIGSVLLLIAAAMDKILGLVVLQSFLNVGSILGLLEQQLTAKVRQVLIIAAGGISCLCLFAILRVNSVVEIREWGFAFTQAFCIGLLAWGYALVNTKAMFVSTVMLAIWASCDAMIRHNDLAWIWVVVNVAFAILTRPGRSNVPAQATT